MRDIRENTTKKRDELRSNWCKCNYRITKELGGGDNECYTRYEDIESEINQWVESNSISFKNKTVFCCCDDPEWSNFTAFFVKNFTRLELHKLICVGFAHKSKDEIYNHKYPLCCEDIEWMEYESEERKCSVSETEAYGKGRKYVVTKRNLNRTLKEINKPNPQDRCLDFTSMEGNGGFESQECLDIARKSDFIITNPPFELIVDGEGKDHKGLFFYEWLHFTQKKFLFIAPKTALRYDIIATDVKNDKVYVGYTWLDWFLTSCEPQGTKKCVEGQWYKKVGCLWLSNVKPNKQYGSLGLYDICIKNSKCNLVTRDNIKVLKQYRHIPEDFNVLEVTNWHLIPVDYTGYMAVPATFMKNVDFSKFNVYGQCSCNGSDGRFIVKWKRSFLISNGTIVFDKELNGNQLYVFRTIAGDKIKVGITGNGIDKRTKNATTYVPEGLNIIAQYKGSDSCELEKHLLKKFRTHRVQRTGDILGGKEWLYSDCEHEVLDEIDKWEDSHSELF